jgi:polyisoprenoid-binding protein YceI
MRFQPHLLSHRTVPLPRAAIALALLAVGGTLAQAAPVSYQIEPSHTYPSFEADHMGVSVWRGKFNTTRGEVTLDRSSGRGSLEIAVDTASIDFGHDQMNGVARGTELFDTAKFPTAVYKGRLEGFVNGVPTRTAGELTLHGVTRPLELKIQSFKCIPHPMLKRELCGADVLGTLQRDEFGIDAGKAYGFSMEVTLRIQVEAIQAE